MQKQCIYTFFCSIFAHNTILGQGQSGSSSTPTTQGVSGHLQESGVQRKLRDINNKDTTVTDPLGGSTTDTKTQAKSDNDTKTAKQKRNKDAHDETDEDEPDEEEPDEEEPDEDESGKHSGGKKSSVDGKRKEA